MSMHKKDYEAIAAIIADLQAYGQVSSNMLANQIADYCATQDPTFKRDRFLKDCGVQS